MEVAEENIEWLEPMQALTTLKPSFESVRAKALIADWLRDGFVRAKAQKVWISNEPTLGRAWKNRAAAIPEADVLIDPKTWEISPYWAEDRERWKWRTGRFVVTRRKKPAHRTILVGVTFAAPDILSMLRDGIKPQTIGKKVGRKPNYIGWAKFGLALVHLERTNGLNQSNLINKTQFAEKLYRIMIADGTSVNDLIDHDSIRKVLGHLWEDTPAIQLGSEPVPGNNELQPGSNSLRSSQG